MVEVAVQAKEVSVRSGALLRNGNSLTVIARSEATKQSH